MGLYSVESVCKGCKSAIFKYSFVIPKADGTMGALTFRCATQKEYAIDTMRGNCPYKIRQLGFETQNQLPMLTTMK